MSLLSDGHHENFVGQHGLWYSLTKDECICTAGYRNVTVVTGVAIYEYFAENNEQVSK